MFNLKKLKGLYQKNENLIEYMRTQSGDKENTTEQIMISYDFQAGTYTNEYYRNPEPRLQRAAVFAEIIKEKNLSGRLMEAGVGEASLLVPLLNMLNAEERKFESVYGFDISWSRIKAARKFASDQNQSQIQFFTGDLLNIPICDDSFDVVCTCHAIEPNGGKEKEILQELYRVCRRYLLLMEPCYEFASERARVRMKKHGYVTKLYQSAVELGYNIEEYGLKVSGPDDINPSGLMIIRKGSSAVNEEKRKSPFMCPISKRRMEEYGNAGGGASFTAPKVCWPIL